MRKWYNKEVHFLYSLSKNEAVKQEIKVKSTHAENTQMKSLVEARVATGGQERRVGMYSTPKEVNIYIYKAVGEMHPSLQI